MTYEYIGFHGTNLENVGSITTESFRKSENSDDWLGYGVYFFVDGISDPLENARGWAKNQAFNQRQYDYDKYSVLKAKVVCKRVLDTTEKEGLRVFDVLRNTLIAKHDDIFVRNRNLKCDDRVMWNLIAQVMKLDAVVHNLYIKDRVQRMSKISSNVPNSTVLCVKMVEHIRLETIEVVCTGEVKS